MHNIIFVERTFGELECGLIPNVQDPFNILSSLTTKMRDAVLHNPSGYANDEVCQILALDGDTVIGCINPFPGRLLMDGEVVPCQNGSSLFSHENYRKENVGGDLFLRLTTLKSPQNGYFAGISQMALGMYKALKYTIFEFPRLIYLRKSRSVIQSIFRSEAFWTKPFISIIDAGLWLHRALISIHNLLRYYRYEIEKAKECPKEVESIIRDDSHRFMELHDKDWFNWCMKYSFSDNERTKKRLYIIKNNGATEAFFLIKQEFFKQASGRGFKNVYLGSVMEWGISKNSKLKEKDIALMSLKTFDHDIDGIQYATENKQTVKQLKRWLFIGVGYANIGVRIRTIKNEGLNDINNWRIRLGGNDTVLD